MNVTVDKRYCLDDISSCFDSLEYESNRLSNKIQFGIFILATNNRKYSTYCNDHVCFSTELSKLSSNKFKRTMKIQNLIV